MLHPVVAAVHRLRASAHTALLLLVASGCAAPETWTVLDPAPRVPYQLELNGTIHYVEMLREVPPLRDTTTYPPDHVWRSDGPWLLRTSSGRYEVLGLPAAFRIEGLSVEVVALLRQDLMSGWMVGDLIELARIRRCEAVRPNQRMQLTGW